MDTEQCPVCGMHMETRNLAQARADLVAAAVGAYEAEKKWATAGGGFPSSIETKIFTIALDKLRNRTIAYLAQLEPTP